MLPSSSRPAKPEILRPCGTPMHFLVWFFVPQPGRDRAVSRLMPSNRGLITPPREMPAEYHVTGYAYTYVNEHPVLVEPRTRRVVEIITRVAN